MAALALPVLGCGATPAKAQTRAPHERANWTVDATTPLPSTLSFGGKTFHAGPKQEADRDLLAVFRQEYFLPGEGGDHWTETVDVQVYPASYGAETVSIAIATEMEAVPNQLYALTRMSARGCLLVEAMTPWTGGLEHNLFETCTAKQTGLTVELHYARRYSSVQLKAFEAGQLHREAQASVAAMEASPIYAPSSP